MYYTNSFWHRILVRFQGYRDGGNKIPSDDATTPSQAVRNIITRANTHISQGQKKARDKNANLQGVQADLENQLEEAEHYYADARNRYTEKRGQMGRDVVIPLPRAGYWTLMVILVLAELPFNWSVFNSVSQESALMTAIMSFVVALSIPAAAHFVGSWIKQWPEGLKTAAQVLVVIAVVVAGLLALNAIRNQFLMSNPDIERTAEALKALEYSFFTINILVFVVASVAAIFTHDNDAQFEQIRDDAIRTSKKRQKILSKLETVRADRDQVLATIEEEIKIIKGAADQLASLYRRANVRRRSGEGAMPPVFNMPLDFAEVKLWAACNE